MTTPIGQLSEKTSNRRAAMVSQVRFWALAGAFSLIMSLTGFIQWVLSSDFVSTETGQNTFSAGRLTLFRVLEAASCTLAIYILWRYLLVPLFKDRTLIFDGMLILAGLVSWFTDVFANYFVYGFAYNTAWTNRGSWANFVPRFSSPNQNLLPEPLLLVGGAWVWWVFGGAFLGCAFMRKLEQAKPSLSPLQRFIGVFIFFALLDLLLETIAVRLEMWAYPVVLKSFSISPGTRFQFPLMEPILMAFWLTGLTTLRYLRDDKGRSFVERGVGTIRSSLLARKVVSLFAVVGFVYLWTIAGLHLPFNLMILTADTPAPLPPYMRAGICGAGTRYACPSGLVPVPNRGSLYIGPDDPRLYHSPP